MTDTENITLSDTSELNKKTKPLSPTSEAARRYNAEFSSIDRRASGSTGLFSGSEKLFATIVPRTTHWSVAWSDLMMTMFVLFLSMFVYQAAHQDFLVSDEKGIIGGETTEALELSSGSTFPFSPIKPGMPLANGGSVKKVEPLPLDEVETESSYIEETPEEAMKRLQENLDRELSSIPDLVARKPLQPLPEPEEEEVTETTNLVIVEKPVLPPNNPEQDLIQPRPLEPRSAPVVDQGSQEIRNMYSAGQEELAKNKLEKFASVELVPDKTVRIILTGDLLFDLGRADLSPSSIESLRQISSIIAKTPYMINVVGHTDNTPMSSGRFASNWELSVARASTVARFLIENMNMDPNQFVVSGYSSYRPVKPNTNVSNRAANRRVEIIVSKRLPAPVQANSTTSIN